MRAMGMQWMQPPRPVPLNLARVPRPARYGPPLVIPLPGESYGSVLWIGRMVLWIGLMDRSYGSVLWIGRMVLWIGLMDRSYGLMDRSYGSVLRPKPITQSTLVMHSEKSEDYGPWLIDWLIDEFFSVMYIGTVDLSWIFLVNKLIVKNISKIFGWRRWLSSRLFHLLIVPRCSVILAPPPYKNRLCGTNPTNQSSQS